MATSSLQNLVLEKLRRLGIENGVTNLRMIKVEEAMEIEHELHCFRALWSPSTGIINSHAVMLVLQVEADENITIFSFNTSVIGGQNNEGDICLQRICIYFFDNPNIPPQINLDSNIVIHFAGLRAPSHVRRFDDFPYEDIHNTYYAHVCYFTLSEIDKAPFHNLIYLVLEDGGIGVHVTLNMGGQLRFGPDVEWLDDIDNKKRFLTMYDNFIFHYKPCHFFV